MALHRYSLGQHVRLKKRLGLPLKTPETFEIVGFLPPNDGVCQYRIRSNEERYERVMQEDDLEIFDPPPADKLADNSNVPGDTPL